MPAVSVLVRHRTQKRATPAVSLPRPTDARRPTVAARGRFLTVGSQALPSPPAPRRGSGSEKVCYKIGTGDPVPQLEREPGGG